ncbi:hypothetical protein [Pectobacterium versatile]|nr:hypothetical protein [Pectobacterium versatile]MBN3195477.1 hypothetical protein [Pectobacterium versatile]
MSEDAAVVNENKVNENSVDENNGWKYHQRPAQSKRLLNGTGIYSHYPN